MLRAEEIRRGDIAYFEQAVLHGPEMHVIPDVHGQLDKLRPFVCLSRDGDTSSWAGLTTSRTHLSAVLLEPEHVADAYGPIAERRCYIHGTVYTGPNHLFVTASASELRYTGGRPHVSERGMQLVELAVRNRELQKARREERRVLGRTETLPLVWEEEEQAVIWFPEFSGYGRFGSRGVTIVENPVRATTWARHSDAEAAATKILAEGVLIKDHKAPMPFYRGPFELHTIALRPRLVRRQEYNFGDLDAPLGQSS